MRVLWVSKGLGPGGAERLLVSVAGARAADEVSYEAAYVLPGKQQLVPELAALGVPTHLLAGRRGMGDPRWPLRLRRLARRFDVVHFHSPAVAAVARPLVHTLRPRIATVTTEHNVWSSHALATRVANAMTIGLDDAVLAVSDEVAASMRGPVRRRVQVLVHGVPVARVQASLPARDDARASLGLAAADPVVVTIANLRATKDYPNLLRAAGTVARRVPGVRFLAAGQGPLADELRAEAASLGLGATFTFLGHVEDPLPLLAAADVFVLASRHEGLSIALLEAMTAGLPVVVTTVGAAPSVVTEGREGVLVPSGDPDALADAIVALLADPARRQSMGAAAAARAEAFDIVGAARQLEAVYRRVLSGS